jgi:hypothetical protein
MPTVKITFMCRPRLASIRKEYSDGIRSAEQELRSLQSRDGDQEAFFKYVAEVLSTDMAAMWQKATPEQKKRVQTLLLEGGLTYSEETESSNPSNSSLFSRLEVFWGSESSLASPTGLTPVYRRERRVTFKSLNRLPNQRVCARSRQSDPDFQP